MGYKREAVKGVGWLGLLRVLTRIAAIAKTAVLARLLMPADFGQFGLAALSLTFFETVTETGVNQMLIQSNRKMEDLVDSAWIISIVRGIAIGLFIALLAYPLSLFFNNSGLIQLTVFLAIIPVIKGFINPMIIEFQKELKFSREFKFRTILVFVDIVVSVVAALAFHSAYAFVFALLSGAIIEVALSFMWCPIRPKLKFVPAHFSEIFSFGKWVTLSGIGHWLASELDDLLAGRLYGAGALGIYQAAYKTSTLPVTEIAGTVNQVAFPILSKVKEDRKLLFKAFAVSMAGTMVVGLAIVAVLFFFPSLIVNLLLGPKWEDAIPIIRLLALFGLLRTAESSVQPLFLVVGKPHVATFGGFLKVIALVIGLAVWGRQGIYGIAFAALVSIFIVVPYYAIQFILLSREKP